MAIITISREMGTGAYQIATELAKRLRYTLIDGAKIIEVAASYGLTPELLERVDEKPPVYITAQDRLNASYLNTIELILLEGMKKGNVIVYGRGGQDLIPCLKTVIRVRFIAPFEERVENFAEREWVDPDLAHELIRKNDHQRGGFIHYYYDRDWNDPLEYDLVFNTVKLSRSAIVDAIVAAVKDPKIKAADKESEIVLENLILRKKIETEILKSPEVSNQHFIIEVVNSHVRLSGHVHSDLEREDVIRITRGVNGVASVEDNLQIMVFKIYKER